MSGTNSPVKGIGSAEHTGLSFSRSSKAKSRQFLQEKVAETKLLKVSKNIESGKIKTPDSDDVIMATYAF